MEPVRADAPNTQMPLDIYLAESKGWERRKEWIDGRLLAMSGGSPRHAAVAVNLVLHLGRLLEGRPCRVTNSDQRLHIEAENAFYYPDVMVVCDAWEASSTDPDSVLNPGLIIEVLSPSTRAHDLGTKLEHYLRIPSARTVLMVDPEAQLVIVHRRHDLGWYRTEQTAGTVATHLGDIPFSAIYSNLGLLPTTATR
jgi:Uma2 family endonuclease